MNKIISILLLSVIMLMSGCGLQSDLVHGENIECEQAIENNDTISIGLWDGYGCCIVSFYNPCTGDEPMLQYYEKRYMGFLVEVGVYKYEFSEEDIQIQHVKENGDGDLESANNISIQKNGSMERTVRALMPKKEYDAWKKCDIDLLRSNLDAVLYKTQLKR